MANIQENENGKKQDSDSSFLYFAKPYFDYIGKGKIYRLVYIINAFLNLLIPFGVVAAVVQSGYLKNSGPRVITAFIFAWLVIAFASWIGFQLWWYRKSNLKQIESMDFIATPVISEIIQTMGECLGTFIGITGAGIGLIAAVFLGSSKEFHFYGYSFFEFGPLAIIAGPVAGFFIILIFRFIAEQIRIWAAIANNTREIAKRTK
jgi:hypothetical protein